MPMPRCMDDAAIPVPPHCPSLPPAVDVHRSQGIFRNIALVVPTLDEPPEEWEPFRFRSCGIEEVNSRCLPSQGHLALIP